MVPPRGRMPKPTVILYSISPYDKGNTVTTNQTYDNAGRLTESSIASLVKLRYNYNAATGNLDSIQRSDSNGNNDQTYSLAYNLYGDVLNVRVGSRELARYEYGDRGLLLKQTY